MKNILTLLIIISLNSCNYGDNANNVMNDSEKYYLYNVINKITSNTSRTESIEILGPEYYKNGNIRLQFNGPNNDKKSRVFVYFYKDKAFRILWDKYDIGTNFIWEKYLLDKKSVNMISKNILIEEKNGAQQAGGAEK